LALLSKDKIFQRKEAGGVAKAPKAPKEPKAPKAEEAAGRPKPGMADYIAGEQEQFVRNLYPYLPHELVGGSIPHVAGTEEEAVWNAASQATGTERVHYVFTADEGRLWYLACPSAALASNPDSWCPLAAALPGNSEYWDRETVYLYEQEGVASALRWDPETARMQVFLGAARTLLPRIQSMDANFVTINAEVAKIVPWRNRQLRTEKLSRASAMALLYAGLVINFIAVLVLLGSYLITNFVERDLATVKLQTENAANSLMINALNALQSDTIKHMVRIQELADHLAKIDGTLVKYEVNKGSAVWEALVPQSFSNCAGTPLGACQIQPGLEPDGRVRIRGTK